jgi:alanine-glyoxylate transaminase/serine-glyoxylate transaminase/serine-pyruvate transaminase
MEAATLKLMAQVSAAPQAPKRFLYGPGPTQVDESVYQAMTQNVVGHLDPYFFEVATDVRRGLRSVFGTTNEMTLAISGTGSSAMETAICNFAGAGTKFAVFCAGYFADRMSDMARRHGATVVRAEKAWGETFSDDEARAFIRREKPDIVGFIHAETSTGALQKADAICEAAHEVGALVIGDVVTSLGAVPVRVDELGIDVAYSCTQKGLSCPPGLGPLTVSPRALERLSAKSMPNDVWYFDLTLLRDYYDGKKYHHTASATLYYALQRALRLIEEEGVEKRWQRHAEAHRYFVERIEAMGLSMLVPEGRRIPNLNTVRVPENVDEAKVRARLLEEHGIEVSGGFGPLAGKIFRIGLMGPLATREGVEFFMDAFEKVLG